MFSKTLRYFLLQTTLCTFPLLLRDVEAAVLETLVVLDRALCKMSKDLKALHVGFFCLFVSSV